MYVQTLIDLYEKVYTTNPSFARKPDFCISHTNMHLWNMNKSGLGTYEIVIILFHINDRDKNLRRFELPFLCAKLGMDISLEMIFFTLINVEDKFHNQYLN